MALQNDLTQLRGFLGTIKEQKSCYFRVSQLVIDSKDEVFFSLAVYEDSTKAKYILDLSSQDLEDSYEGLSFSINKSGVNYMTQIYEQLKAVEYFQEAISV